MDKINWRSAVLLIASWFSVVVMCYALMEVFLFGFIVRHMPANLPYAFDLGARVIFQYTKSGDIPKNYIAVFGDSYAEGLGDWFFREQDKRMPDTQATHVLHRLTGKDVVTFGVAGAGSISAYLEYPAVAMAYIRSLWFYDIQDPDIIFLYFYEGNDILDNGYDYRVSYLGKGYDAQRLSDLHYFKEFVTHEFLKTDNDYPGNLRRDYSRNFMVARFFMLAIKSTFERVVNRQFGVPNVLTPVPLDNAVTAAIRGERASLPRQLGAAPLDRTAEETRIAMTIFENSLKLVSQSYPRSKIGVVYIPSPSSVYDFYPGSVVVATEKSSVTEYPTEALAPASNILCERVRLVVIDNNMHFHDTRTAFRQAASGTYIHGPGDWDHFSEAGYRVLGQELERYLRRLEAVATPDERVATPCAVLN